jgi:predicted esterase YcpF (UPF0227 family)
MNIIFLHGLESTPETSSTAKLITDNFANVYVPHYNPNIKDSTYLRTREGLKSRCESTSDHYDIAIGISIGGFWALHMTEFTNIKKVILINPAIVRGEAYYNIKLNTPNDVVGQLLMNMDDEVVDNKENYELYKGKFSTMKFYKGGHRASNHEEILEAIERTVNIFSTWSP